MESSHTQTGLGALPYPGSLRILEACPFSVREHFAFVCRHSLAIAFCLRILAPMPPTSAIVLACWDIGLQRFVATNLRTRYACRRLCDRESNTAWQNPGLPPSLLSANVGACFSDRHPILTFPCLLTSQPRNVHMAKLRSPSADPRLPQFRILSNCAGENDRGDPQPGQHFLLAALAKPAILTLRRDPSAKLDAL